MTENNFDPIDFLNLTNLPKDQQEKLRIELFKDVAKYLLTRFVEELNEVQAMEIESKKDKIKTFEEVLKIIASYNPGFELKKIDYLNEYKKSFNLEEFKKNHA